MSFSIKGPALCYPFITSLIYICIIVVITNRYILLTKREVKVAGYWPSSLFAFLWTETKSRSIKTQKENEANTQPS